MVSVNVRVKGSISSFVCFFRDRLLEVESERVFVGVENGTVWRRDIFVYGHGEVIGSYSRFFGHYVRYVFHCLG